MEQKNAVARKLGRVLFSQDFAAKFPQADAQAKKASWEQSRKPYIKKARGVLNQLEKQGVKIENA